MKKKSKLIVISGNIGAGKSTLTYLLAGKFRCEILREEVDDYVYVKDFYSDMQRWSFHSQLQFILHKFKQQASVKSLSGLAYQDRSAYECYEVFSRKLFDDGLMTSRDFKCLTEFYNLVSACLPFPDLIVHLKTPVEILLDRIKKRGRVFEQEITYHYLVDLEERYYNWIQSVKFCPVLIIETDQFDFASVANQIEQAVEIMLAKDVEQA